MSHNNWAKWKDGRKGIGRLEGIALTDRTRPLIRDSNKSEKLNALIHSFSAVL